MQASSSQKTIGTVLFVAVCSAFVLAIAFRDRLIPPDAASKQTEAGPASISPAGNPGSAAQAAAPPGGPSDPAESLYGDQGGQPVSRADPSIPDALLRSRKDDTFFKLSNARMGNDRFGRPTLFVDYEKTRIGPHNGVTMVIHDEDGHRQSVMIMGSLADSRGTLDVAFRWPTFPGSRGAPRNAEIYFTRVDGRYGMQPAPTFKVSNSTILGTMARRTPVRAWTAEEFARFSNPPPNWSNPNAHPAVGTDTAFVGTEGGVPLRYVEPGGNLLGVEYGLGEWDGEKCLNGLVPIYDRKQPPQPLTKRVVAKDGYAVASIEVQSKRFVNAVRLTYAKLGEGGRLDVADTYASDWFGEPAPGGSDAPPAVELRGDGASVIGIHLRKGAILNAVALVIDPDRK